MNNQFERNSFESLDEYLWRLGSMKEQGFCNLTWPELAKILNAVSEDGEYTESYWRKRYRQMAIDREVEHMEEPYDQGSAMAATFSRFEKQRIRAKEQRNAYANFIRQEARKEDLFELLAESIARVEPVTPCAYRTRVGKKAIYAMLSDIHFGISFKSYDNSYDSDIAKERVMRYAASIIQTGRENKACCCYVSLMGDLVSGVIHNTIRLESRENLIQQVTGVSELVAMFLYELAKNFDEVHVNSVDGNHSRIDPNLENVMRGEKLDALIPWYCKARLDTCDNIVFYENEIDVTIAAFEIYGKLYIAVHGDMDNDLKTSAQRIEKLIQRPIDYLLAGHMHIADMRCEDTVFIRNGCVCGSGDEYTAKKRLYGPPVQVCMIVDEDGVKAVCPVRL